MNERDKALSRFLLQLPRKVCPNEVNSKSNVLSIDKSIKFRLPSEMPTDVLKMFYSNSGPVTREKPFHFISRVISNLTRHSATGPTSAPLLTVVRYLVIRASRYDILHMLRSFKYWRRLDNAPLRRR